MPDVQVCPEHTTPWRAFADAYFARSPVAVWKASRGFGGKSFLLALLATVEAATLKADVTVLAGSGEQSQRVLGYMRKFWEKPSAPKRLLLGDVKREIRFAWGNTVQALLASQTSVRGPHPQRLRLDEVDEMDQAIFDAALGQPMGVVGIKEQTVISSTHQNPAGVMTEVLRRAHEQGWPVYEWCYKETSATGGWLTEETIETARQRVPAGMWQVEYELQEPTAEGRAVMPEAVAEMFKPELGEFRGEVGEHVLAERPDPNGLYVTAADWARKTNYTEIGTLRTDTSPMRLVAFGRYQREPWPLMIRHFRAQAKLFHAAGVHDATGLGDVVDQYLDYPAEGVLMVGRRRVEMLSGLISAIERGELEAPLIYSLRDELKYASVDDVYGSGHLPDGMAMLALAWYATRSTKPVEIVENPFYGG